MSGDVESRALALFTEALEQPEAVRAAWLAGRAGADEALWAAVQALLAADADADDAFLESPLAPLSAVGPGTRFGAFEIVDVIGAGGMGCVYRGRRADGAFQQEVAIKVFEARFSSTGVRRRFEAERGILATLEHPGIARVIDGGATEAGMPYLVMELVRGQRITDYCDSAGLGLEDRLKLFQRVCRAVEFAHARGIIHRDLKPDNVLVTEEGDPKLIDFGIAKVLDPELLAGDRPLTRTQAQLMTPEYASPEQVKGDAITATSDVYALGVLLYELLSGSRPYHFEALTPAAIERTVCETVPSNPSDLVSRRRAPPPGGLERPRQLRRRLRGDLDRIAMTALRKAPERRYASALALSEDIDRYLSGEPVRARGASMAYRLRKFVQRNRAASVALAVVFLTLSVALVLVLRQAAEAERQRDAAEVAAARATSAKEFLVELIGRSDPFENTESATLAGALRQSVDGMETRFAGQPGLEAEMRYAIGYALQNLGEIPLARAQMERAAELRATHGSAEDRAEVLDGLGIVNWWESDFETGELRFAEALAMLDGLESERARRLRVNVLNNLAGLRVDAGEYALSVEASEAALAAADGLGLDGETRASIWGNLANALGSIEGRETESIAAFENALAMQAEATGEMHPNYAIILNNLALTHYVLGNLEDMSALFERSLEIRRATLGPDHPQTATALFNLAGGQVVAGQFEAAEPNALEALRVAENGYEAGHPRIGKAHETLAKVYRALERPTLARDHGSRALVIYQAAPGVDPAWISSVESILQSLRNSD